MNQKSAVFSKEFVLIKLARLTSGFTFVSETLREPYNRLLCRAVHKICSPLDCWHECLEVLSVPSETYTALSEKDTGVKPLKKHYPAGKGFFSPRITYKYVFLAEVCYIYILCGEQTAKNALADLCRLFRLRKKIKTVYEAYMSFITEKKYSELINLVKNTRLKSFEETCLPLAEFIVKEAEYYALPRRNITVFSTMSAGKSTFINALLGHDYLPSKNEACTAKIASISDNDSIDYALGCAVKKGKKIFSGNVTQKQIEEWNNDSGISEIVLEGNLDRISAGKVVTVIHDTPGINYSGNPEHKKMTLSHLVESKPDAVICLLDATQMLITDFSEALDSLKKALKGGPAQVLFVINKADIFDPEKESLKKAVAGAAAEIEKHGFENPAVIPVSSKAARLFKMALRGKAAFIGKEMYDFISFFEFFTCPENNFNALATGIPDKCLRNSEYETGGIPEIVIKEKTYDKEQLKTALNNTGITVIENILNTHKEFSK
jgi:ribosome biogenesis GTPase A